MELVLGRATAAIGTAVATVALFGVVAVVDGGPPATCEEVRSEVDGPLKDAVHYYRLTGDTVAGGMVCDSIGDADGEISGDVRFGPGGATFDGGSSIVIPDRPEFSAAVTGAVTVVAVVSIDDWAGGSQVQGEYVHWLGKGRPGEQEWVFRQYDDKAGDRSRRVSFYAFSPGGGLGTGSYFEGRDGEMVVAGVLRGSAENSGTTEIFLGGESQDRDRLSGYDTVPEDTGSPVVFGSRGDGTGFLKGRLRDVVFFDRALTGDEVAAVSEALAK